MQAMQVSFHFPSLKPDTRQSSTLKTAGVGLTFNFMSSQTPMSVLALPETQKRNAEKFSSTFPQILFYKATCSASRKLCQENSCRQKSSQSLHQDPMFVDLQKIHHLWEFTKAATIWCNIKNKFKDLIKSVITTLNQLQFQYHINNQIHDHFAPINPIINSLVYYFRKII